MSTIKNLAQFVQFLNDFPQTVNDTVDKMRKGELVVTEAVYTANKKASQKFDEFAKKHGLILDKVVVESANRGQGEGGEKYFLDKNPDMKAKVAQMNAIQDEITKLCKDQNLNLKLQFAWHRADTEKSLEVILK